eukprot:SAG31_NODE_5632_length_2412_cov_6.545179_3_plen_259_part_00
MGRRVVLSSDSDDDGRDGCSRESLAAAAPLPPAKATEKGAEKGYDELQAGVRAVIREAADPGALTMKTIRAAVEMRLHLQPGGLNDRKAEVKRLVELEFEAVQSNSSDAPAGGNGDGDDSSPEVMISRVQTKADRTAKAKQRTIDLALSDTGSTAGHRRSESEEDERNDETDGNATSEDEDSSDDAVELLENAEDSNSESEHQSAGRGLKRKQRTAPTAVVTASKRSATGGGRGESARGEKQFVKMRAKLLEFGLKKV